MGELRAAIFQEVREEITGGNAEVAEKEGIAKKATRKFVPGKGLQIDGGTETRFVDRKARIMRVSCRWCGRERT